MRKIFSLFAAILFAGFMMATTYTVAGSSDVAFGTTWAPTNTANDMTLVGGLYKWEKTGLTLAAGNILFKVCEDHAWTTAYPAQNYELNIPEAGVYTLTITYNPEGNVVNGVAQKTDDAVVIPSVAMHGNFLGSWADTENFAIAEGNETASLTLNLAAGDYEFGMRIGGSGNWTSNGVAFTRENNAAEVVAGQGNLTLAADVAGEYTFTWTYATNNLAITFPAAASAEMTAIYDWAGEIGTTIFGGNRYITTGTVKIHENTDDVNGIKFGSSYVYADGKYVAIKPAEGAFKAGDVLSVSVVFNNSDVTKYCMADVYAADQTTRLFRSDSASTLNGRNAGEPIVQTYTLAADQDSLFLGRYGNTGMFITLLKVERAGGVTPEPTHTYTVAGGSDVAFGTAWDPTNTANDMVLVEGLYTWEKADLTLAAGSIGFKVCEDHAWTTAYPAQDYQLNIPEAGIYTITITFNADTKEVNAVATKTCSAVVLPTIAMHGNFLGSWADTENFTVAEGDATASLTLNLAAGNYEFGMRIGGSGNWTSNGVAFTRENNAAEVVAGQGNLTLAADVAGEYTFTWTYETNTLTITYPEFVPPTYTYADGYYLIGLDMQDWTMEYMPTEGRLFAANPDNEGEYQLTITLAADQQFKVVSVQKDQIKAWYPDGMDNNFIVDAAHAGEKTVYFRPDYQGGEGWFANCIFIVPTSHTDIDNVNAAVEAVKVLREGQILIIKGNKTFNAQGQLVK